MGRRRSRIEKKKYLNPEVADASLVAHYKLWAGFEKPVVAGVSDGSVFDYSLNGNSGVIDKDNAVTVPAYPGFSFDGADSLITVAADPTIDANGKTALSISAWINPASDGELNNGRIVGKTGLGTTGYKFIVSNDNAAAVKLESTIFHDGVADSVAVTNTLPVALNTWSFVAMVYNEDGAKKIKIYVNSVLIALSTDTAGVGTIDDDSALALIIGNETGVNRTFDGLIDDVRIWPNARSAIQMRDLYNQTRWRYSV